MDKKLVALLLALASLAAVTLVTQNQPKTMREQFDQWKAEHGLMLDLTPEENEYRLRVFTENVEVINQHNGLLGRSYDKGVNKFTAYTQAEFEAKFLSKIEATSKYDVALEPTTQGLTVDIDWVAKGAVSPVKNQGSCTASYAFSAVGGIEGISVIFYKQQMEYSVQQVVDCSSTYGNNGCTTGTMVGSFNYIAARGLNSWNSYPYVARVGSCQAQTGLFKIKGYSNVTSCSALDSALTIRPVSVAVDGQNFANYHSGIFDNCGTSLSLAVLLVGSTDFYYTVKNAWGTTWGEGGYIRLLKKANICGICLAASYPIPA